MTYPIFLPNFGCKPRCIYCDQRYITDQKEVTEEYLLESLKKLRPGSELGIYGGDLLGLDGEAIKRIFSYIDDFSWKISRITISTRPKPLTKDTMDLVSYLVSKKVRVFELGIPTFNESILSFLNRGHGLKELQEMYSYLLSNGVEVALQVMVGLPFEERKDVVELVRNLISLRPSYVRIYPLVLIEGTPLQRLVEEGSVRLCDFEETLRRTSFIYASLRKEGIEVRKIGLTESESLKKRVVGGFYHPAFGYLVRSFLFLETVKTLINDVAERGKIKITVRKSEIPHVYGYRRENLKALKDLGIELELGVHELDPELIVLSSSGGENLKSLSILDVGCKLLQ